MSSSPTHSIAEVVRIDTRNRIGQQTYTLYESVNALHPHLTYAHVGRLYLTSIEHKDSVVREAALDELNHASSTLARDHLRSRVMASPEAREIDASLRLPEYSWSRLGHAYVLYRLVTNNGRGCTDDGAVESEIRKYLISQHSYATEALKLDSLPRHIPPPIPRSGSRWHVQPIHPNTYS